MRETGREGEGPRKARGRSPGAPDPPTGGGARGRVTDLRRRTPVLRGPHREREKPDRPDEGSPGAPRRIDRDEARSRDTGRAEVEVQARRLGLREWAAVLGRVRRQIGADNIGITAAGMAFYLMLSIVPALLAAVLIYGMVSDPSQVQRQIDQVSEVMPGSAVGIVQNQLRDLVSSSKTGLSIGAIVSVLLALWSASKGAKAMITGINIAYDEAETRKSWKVQALALAFTLGFVVFGIVSLALIAFFPWMFERLAAQLGIGPVGSLLASTTRWVLLFLAVVAALSMAYRYAPDHPVACRQCVRWGAAVASLLWLIASVGFSWYAASFGTFNETYGSLAGIVVFLLWLQIGSYAVLLGAELASELEEQLAPGTVRESAV